MRNSFLIIIIAVVNRRRKVQQRRSSTRSNRKHTLAPLAAAMRGPCVTLEHSLQSAGISWFLLRGENPEKPSKQRREPTQTQPTYGVGSGNRTRATLVGGECSYHCAIPALPILKDHIDASTGRNWLPDH